MIAPAISYKDEIMAYSDKLRYSQQMLFYNGCREHGRMSIKEDWDDGGVYQWAILNTKGELVGYIAYNVDFFSSSAYSFGLIAFKDDKMAMANGIRDVMMHIDQMHLQRIEFRCIWDNPAAEGYRKILRNHVHGYLIQGHHLSRVFRDEGGMYHDVLIFELIDWDVFRKEDKE